MRTTKLTVLILVLGVAFGAQGCFAVDLANLEGWDIVTSPSASPSEIYAAQEMRDFLHEAGAPLLAIVSSVSHAEHHIFIGYGSDMAGSNVGFSVAGFGDERFRMVIGDDNIAIAGGQPRGTLYGVYAFLEDYVGVRFLTYDDTYVPAIAEEQLVGPVDRSYEPPFSLYRYAGYPMTFQNPVFAVRHRQNAITADESLGGRSAYYVIGHSFYRQVPIDVYGESHPEYYGLWDGTRRNYYLHTHLCVTNPDLVGIVTDAVTNEINQPSNSWRRNYAVSQNDTLWQYCQCSECMAVDTAQNSHMGAMLGFVNSIADNFAVSHPDYWIGTLAYGFTRKPPATIVPRDNVQINLCSIEVCQLHSFDDPTCPTNAAFLADLQGWGAKCTHDNLLIWNYGLNYNDWLLPYPNLYTFKDNFQTAINNGVKAMYVQLGVGYEDALEMSDLRNYVVMRMLWDPSLDTDDLIDEFVTLHYGQAGPYIRQFLDLVYNYYSSEGTHQASCISGQWDLPVDATVASDGLDLFIQALDAAENETIRERVEKASICAYRAIIDPIWQMEEDATIEASSAEYYQPLCEEFFRLCDKFGMTTYVTAGRTRVNAILARSLPYSGGNWRFQDDFNDRAAGSILNGTNGWVDAYDMYGSLYEQVMINADKRAVETSAGWGTASAAGAGRDISGDVRAGNYEVRMCFYGEYHAPEYVDFNFFQ
ncbi:MAG: DUF4838 domain-containing protein [Sedimentisphaerales bacterium]|nr:DUF4838 domain-containing protein [Sedimentisphaerales bacterium]